MAGPRRVIRAIINNGALARLTVGYLFFITKRNAAWIGVLVFAFHHGGATASGLVATVLVLPPVVLGPILSTVADRRSPTALLAGAYLAQALALGAIAVAIWLGVTPFLVYALALVEQAFSVAAPPGLYAGLPAIAHDAGELASANVAAGWAETAGLLGGSVVVSVLLSLHALGALFAVAGALMAIAAVLAQPVRIRALAAVTDLGDSDRLRSLAEGVRVVASRPRVRLMVSLIWAQYAVVGALDVLLVVVAIQQLGRGQGWVGYLNTTYGIGAVAVGLATASLVARRTGATVGCVAAATLAAFALMAFFPAAGLALLLVAVLGASRALLILIARARVQISTPPDALGRVFGVAEGLVYLGMAVGAALVPLLIHTVGIRGALLVVGALLPAASLAGSATLRRFDETRAIPVTEVALLRSLSHFAVLPAPVLEGLALALRKVDVPPGTTIVRQGERGDKFYAIAEGEVEVAIDGQPRGTLTRGEGFGEIALLRDAPRTGTVTAVGPVTVYSLAAEPFLAALSGHAPTRRRVDDVATGLLTADAAVAT